MMQRGFTGASSAREVWRRVGVLTAVAAVCAASLMFALTGGSARADSSSAAGQYGPQASADTEQADVYDITGSPAFSALLKRSDVMVACDDSYYESSAQNPPSPCSLYAKVTVGGWTAHFLKLRSRTLASGKMQGPFNPNPRTGTNVDGFVLRDVLSRSLVRKLRSVTLKGLHVDGITLTYSGTATYPVNYDMNGNPVPVTYKKQTFSFTTTFNTPYMNSCWMPVNHAFQVGFADPHGKLCPGY